MGDSSVLSGDVGLSGVRRSSAINSSSVSNRKGGGGEREGREKSLVLWI